MNKILFEYNEQKSLFHVNEIVNGKRFRHDPCTNGYMPICIIEDEIASNESFLDFCETLRKDKTPYPLMFKLVNERVLRWRKDGIERDIK